MEQPQRYDSLDGDEENNTLELNNSIDTDEKAPMVEVVRQKSEKNYRKLISIVFVSVIVIVSSICVITYLNNNELDNDDFYENYTESEEDSNMEAHFSNWGYKKRHRKTCDDSDFGCCRIKYNCKNVTYYSEKIYRDTKKDKQGSNCKTIEQLKNIYNEKYGANCWFNCSFQKECPSIPGLVNYYSAHWPNIEQEMNVIVILFITALCVLAVCVCCNECKHKN